MAAKLLAAAASTQLIQTQIDTHIRTILFFIENCEAKRKKFAEKVSSNARRKGGKGRGKHFERDSVEEFDAATAGREKDASMHTQNTSIIGTNAV